MRNGWHGRHAWYGRYGRHTRYGRNGGMPGMGVTGGMPPGIDMSALGGMMGGVKPVRFQRLFRKPFLFNKVVLVNLVSNANKFVHPVSNYYYYYYALII